MQSTFRAALAVALFASLTGIAAAQPAKQPPAKQAPLVVDGKAADVDVSRLVFAVGENEIAEGGVEDPAAACAEQDLVEPSVRSRADERGSR